MDTQFKVGDNVIATILNIEKVGKIIVMPNGTIPLYYNDLQTFREMNYRYRYAIHSDNFTSDGKMYAINFDYGYIMRMYLVLLICGKMVHVQEDNLKRIHPSNALKRSVNRYITYKRQKKVDAFLQSTYFPDDINENILSYSFNSNHQPINIRIHNKNKIKTNNIKLKETSRNIPLSNNSEKNTGGNKTTWKKNPNQNRTNKNKRFYKVSNKSSVKKNLSKNFLYN